jgi:deazaflavin-dependent oxidoreductase (nitroreductase family)
VTMDVQIRCAEGWRYPSAISAERGGRSKWLPLRTTRESGLSCCCSGWRRLAIQLLHSIQRRELFLHGDEGILLAASNFGQEKHPAWSTNLLKNPDTLVTIRGQEIPVHARLLAGEEREHAWELFKAGGPLAVFAEQTQTGGMSATS